jgi:hypothetical protein
MSHIYQILTENTYVEEYVSNISKVNFMFFQKIVFS